MDCTFSSIWCHWPPRLFENLQPGENLAETCEKSWLHHSAQRGRAGRCLFLHPTPKHWHTPERSWIPHWSVPERIGPKEANQRCFGLGGFVSESQTVRHTSLRKNNVKPIVFSPFSICKLAPRSLNRPKFALASHSICSGNKPFKIFTIVKSSS